MLAGLLHTCFLELSNEGCAASTADVQGCLNGLPCVVPAEGELFALIVHEDAILHPDEGVGACKRTVPLAHSTFSFLDSPITTSSGRRNACAGAALPSTARVAQTPGNAGDRIRPCQNYGSLITGALW